MDRQITFPGAIPLDTDLLNAQRFAMVGLGKLAHAILGDGPFLNNLPCVPTSPASMHVQVNPGQIYSLQNIDNTAYGSLAADIAHAVLKQGLLMDAVQLSCPAPATAGQSINYLVQVAYQDTDGSPVVLPYYNASNPAQAYSGPNNTGAQQDTVRQGKCVVSVKPGVAAAAGTQATPAPDSGYVGAYVVTVAYGATQITAGNITVYVGAPFLTDKLINKITQAQADALYAKLAGLSTQVFSVAPATANNHAVNLGQFASLFNGNGYQKLSGGLTLQWGSGTGSASGGVAVTFPIAFPNGCLNAGATNTNGAAAIAHPNCTGATATGMNVAMCYANTSGVSAYSADAFNWIAIGY